MDDFFATPRKKDVQETKVQSIPLKEETPISAPEISLKEKSSLLQNDFVKKERYSATPKENIKSSSEEYYKKMIQIFEEDYLLLSELENKISFARKRAGVSKYDSERVTANTFIRIAIKSFADKIRESQKHNPGLINSLLTEKDISDYINNLD